MKNPMTTTEMKQAIDDNAAGHPMQRRILYGTQENRVWKDRFAADGSELNFRDCEYRRKPEPQEWFINEYGHVTGAHKTLEAAKKHEGKFLLRRVRVVEDLNWVEPEPEEDYCASVSPEEEALIDRAVNPWRKIVPGEWPKCKPEDEITLRGSKGGLFNEYAGEIRWTVMDATEWRYAEDE